MADYYARYKQPYLAAPLSLIALSLADALSLQKRVAPAVVGFKIERGGIDRGPLQKRTSTVNVPFIGLVWIAFLDRIGGEKTEPHLLTVDRN